MIIKFLLLLLGTFLGYALGYCFTETKCDLQKYKLFQFKAFACRKCLSFHIAWVSNTVFSLYFNNFLMLGIGMFFAFMLFIGLHIDEKERFLKGENKDDF